MDKIKVRSRRAALLDAYNKTYQGTPADTVKLLEERIGAEEARIAVAELVRSVGDWDGRVWGYVRRWADGVEDAASREEMEAAHIYQPSDIHPAHINQLGAQYMKV